MGEYWKSKPSCWYPHGGKLKTYKQGRIVEADENLTPAEVKIMEEFIRATAADGFCNHKISKLEKMLKKSERTIKRALKSLWEKDYIRIERRHNKSSLYMLGCKLVPEAPANQIEETEYQKWFRRYSACCELCPENAHRFRMLTYEELPEELEICLEEQRQQYQKWESEKTENGVTEYQEVRCSWGDMGVTSRGDMGDTPDLTENVTSRVCNS